MTHPDYYDKFKCIAGSCKHNCCRGGWDIEIDDGALERFDAIPGEFGEKVRASISPENVFIRKNGECPLLAPDGTCEMVNNGAKLCIVCDEYPRFTEFFDDYAERGISISCEAAADIILSKRDRTELVFDSLSGCDDPLFRLLVSARSDILDILRDRSKDIFTRMRLALDHGKQLQERINENDYTAFSCTAADTFARHRSLSGILPLFKDLSILDPEWLKLLGKLEERELSAQPHTSDPIETEQLAVYFVYRYMLKAAFDCDVLSKLKFAFLSVIMITALENALGNIRECARLYSIEIEHSEENIEMINDEFLFNDEFSYENIIDMLS